MCANGWFGIEPAFGYGGLKIQTSKADMKEIADLPQINHFAAEMDHLSKCILENKQPDTPGEEGLADMKVIEAIWAAVDSGGTEKV